MNPTFTFPTQQVSQSDGTGLVILVGLFGFLITIYWMRVGWRAMRAHEKLADAMSDLAESQQRANSNR